MTELPAPQDEGGDQQSVLVDEISFDQGSEQPSAAQDHRLPFGRGLCTSDLRRQIRAERG
jgi:hypothetical protein